MDKITISCLLILSLKENIKNMMMARIQNMGSHVPWVNSLSFVFTKHNDNTVHETIGVTPRDATFKKMKSKCGLILLAKPSMPVNTPL